jgi:hypothetical protein
MAVLGFFFYFQTFLTSFFMYLMFLLCCVFISVLDPFSLAPDPGILLNPDPILIQIQTRVMNIKKVD